MARLHPSVALAALLVAFLAIACAAPTPTPTPTPTPRATPTPVVEPPPQGEPGGSLTIASSTAPPHLDVHQDVSLALSSLGPGIVYSRLLRLKSGPQLPMPSLLLECDLCEGWVVEDELTYVFRLRPGVLWQEAEPVQGREVTAEDVVASYNRQRTPGWPNATLLQNVQGLEAQDARTLRITLDAPDADFLLALADGHSKVLPRELTQRDDLREGPVVGSGPWVLTEFRQRTASVYEANPDYFEPGLPFLERLTIQVVPDENVRMAAFLTGSLDLYRVPPEQWEDVRTLGGPLETRLAPRGGVGLLLGLKVTEPPFDRQEVRQALFQALDPWEAVETLWQGQGFVSLGLPVWQPRWLLSEEELRSFFSNPATAQETLAELGGPLRFRLTVPGFGSLYRQHAQRLRQELAAVGFDPVLEELNPVEYTRQVWEQGEYQAFLGPMPPTESPNSFLFSVLHSSGRWSHSGYVDPQLDRMIEEQAREGDVTARGELVRQIQRRVLEQRFLSALVTESQRWVSRPYVQGFFPNPAAAEYFFWAKVWRER